MQNKNNNIFAKYHIDLHIVLALFLLLAFSTFILYSASGQSSSMVVAHISRAGLAFLLMIVVAQIPPKLYIKFTSVLYIFALILLILVDTVGEISKGAQRWLNIGITRIQPSEIFKVVMPLTIAAFLAANPMPPKFKSIIIAFILLLMPTILILRQPDLGTAILVAVSGTIAIFLAGLSYILIFIGFALVLLAIPVMWNYVLHDYQKQRVLTLIDPESDPLGAGYHIIQSKIAIGSGGLYGKGWLQGSQSQLDFLPEPHTDFIFAVLAEELGFVGICILLVLYAYLISRCIAIAIRLKDNFGRILTATFTFTFVFYIFVNIGMVSGILPVVGVPLPMISYGGTAMITLSICFGMIMSISTHTKNYTFR